MTKLGIVYRCHMTLPRWCRASRRADEVQVTESGSHPHVWRGSGLRPATARVRLWVREGPALSYEQDETYSGNVSGQNRR
jgi:hypothetical protein